MAEEKIIYKGADDFMSRIVKDNNDIVEPETEVIEQEVEAIETEPEAIEPEPEVADPEPEIVEPEEEKEVEVDEDGNILNWDSGTDDIVVSEEKDIKPVTPVADYAIIANDLGLSEEGITIATQAELKEAIDNRIKQAEEKDFLEGVPTQLREAVELAKQGGDFVGFLSEKEVDYNDYSQDEFVAMGRQKYFKDEKGIVNEQALQENIESLDPVSKGIEADRVKALLEAKQQARLEGIKVRAQQRRDAEALKARETISKIDSVSGLKLNDKHKEQVLKIVTSGKLNTFLFGEKGGELDYNQVADVVFNKLYGEQIMKVNSQRVRNGTKRGMLDSMSNKNVKGQKGAKPTPIAVKSSPVDSLMAQYGFKSQT